MGDPAPGGDARILRRSATRAFATAQASSIGDAECGQGLVATRLPIRKYGGACTTIQGSACQDRFSNKTFIEKPSVVSDQYRNIFLTSRQILDTEIQ